MYLTEKQRQDALSACDRIQECLARQDQIFKNILRIFDNMANGRDVNDGVVEIKSPEQPPR